MVNKTVHIIGPLSDFSTVLKEIKEEIKLEKKVTVFDLSQGQLVTQAKSKLSLDIEGNEEVLNNIEWLDGISFADKHGEISKNIYINWLANKSNEPLYKNKSIKEIFTYKNKLSLWWLAPISIKHSVRSPLRWLFYMYTIITNELINCKCLHLWVEDKLTADFLGDAVNEDIVVHITKRKNVWKRLHSNKISRPFIIFLKVIRSILNIIIEYLKGIKFKTDDLGDSFDNAVLLQTSYPRSWQRNENFSCPDPQADHYFGDFPWRLEKEGFKVVWMPIFQNRSSKKEWLQQQDKRSIDDVANFMCLKIHDVISLLSATLSWFFIYIWLFEIKNIHYNWRYKEAPLGELLLNNYSDIVWSGWESLKRYHFYQSVVKKINPLSIIYRDEFYKVGRIVSAAAKGYTNLIGVQHGLFGNEHTVYQFDEADIERNGSTDFIHFCPVPDNFCVFGKAFKELLEKWDGFSIKNVKVTGGVRHDYLFENYSNLGDEQNKQLRQKLSLPVDKPIILLCTGLKAQVNDWTNLVAEAIIKCERELYLVIKVHQFNSSEKDVAKALNKFKKLNYTIFKESIYSLIAVSDCIIGGGSTVLIETNMLGKGGINLSDEKVYRHFDFKSIDGIYNSTTNSTELASKICRVLDTNVIRRNPRYFNNVRESASNNIAQLLSSMSYKK